MRGLLVLLLSTTAWAQVTDDGGASTANASLEAAAPLPPRHRFRPAAIAVAGVALAALLAGAGSYGVGASQFNQLHDVTCVARKCTPGDWGGAETAVNAGYGLFAVAGAAAAADVVLWILQVRY